MENARHLEGIWFISLFSHNPFSIHEYKHLTCLQVSWGEGYDRIMFGRPPERNSMNGFVELMGSRNGRNASVYFEQWPNSKAGWLLFIKLGYNGFASEFKGLSEQLGEECAWFLRMERSLGLGISEFVCGQHRWVVWKKNVKKILEA